MAKIISIFTGKEIISEEQANIVKEEMLSYGIELNNIDLEEDNELIKELMKLLNNKH